MSVFRQKEMSGTRSIEAWSDGSYYLGSFKDGTKQGKGVYFWSDGSRHTGDWVADEMSG